MDVTSAGYSVIRTDGAVSLSPCSQTHTWKKAQAVNRLGPNKLIVEVQKKESLVEAHLISI